MPSRHRGPVCTRRVPRCSASGLPCPIRSALSSTSCAPPPPSSPPWRNGAKAHHPGRRNSRSASPCAQERPRNSARGRTGRPAHRCHRVDRWHRFRLRQFAPRIHRGQGHGQNHRHHHHQWHARVARLRGRKVRSSRVLPESRRHGRLSSTSDNRPTTCSWSARERARRAALEDVLELRVRLVRR